MVSESFNCNIYKIIETGEKSLTLMLNVGTSKHKEEIVKKLRKLGHKVSDKTANNKLVKMSIVNIDYIKGDEIGR